MQLSLFCAHRYKRRQCILAPGHWGSHDDGALSWTIDIKWPTWRGRKVGGVMVDRWIVKFGERYYVAQRFEDAGKARAFVRECLRMFRSSVDSCHVVRLKPSAVKK